MRLGIIGGGQLARMLALAARPLGIECVVVEPTPMPPAGPVARVIEAEYDDEVALAKLAGSCDVVTVELEALSVEALQQLTELVPVRPNPLAIAASNDRLLEKQLLRHLGIGTAPFDDEVPEPPMIVKTRRGGFDGRGNRLVHSAQALADARAEMPDPIVEGFVTFARELSIICARSVDGDVRFYPVVENTHERGILRRTTAPAPGLAPPTQSEAEWIARAIVEHLDYVGVLAVELFELDDGSLLANEIAPRVHNSGHWTIEGAHTSQFEQHVRAVLGLPLGDSSPRCLSVMLNAVGQEPDPAEVMAVPGAHLHSYGKAPRPGRKLGHVTVTGRDEQELAERVRRLNAVVPFLA